MRMSDIEALNVTTQELKVISDWAGELSDISEMCDGTWGVEWDTNYGRYWDRYETEELAYTAIDLHSDKCVEMLPLVREQIAEWDREAKEAAIIKGQRIAAEKRAIKEAKTIGGNCPELAELLVKMRNERKQSA